MNVSIHISGLILFLAGVLFLVSALISRQVYLYAASEKKEKRTKRKRRRPVSFLTAGKGRLLQQ